MDNQETRLAKQLLAEPKKVAIIPHKSPDGDAMGSTLALYQVLKKCGHDPRVIAPNDFPPSLAWLPYQETVIIFEKEREKAQDVIAAAQLIFVLDFNALHRTGDMEQPLMASKAPFIMIDHHQEPANFAAVTYSDTSIGSTCEMLYYFLVKVGLDSLIDASVATCLYTGIVTDSGSFRFASTTAQTHRVAAELISRGADNALVHPALFDNNSYHSLQLLGRALQNLVLMPEHSTSYITLSQKELDEYHYVKGDTEGIVNYGLSIKGIKFTAIFIEHTDENIVKISFRSKGDFDVNKFARQHFNGGGHINAAGGKSQQSLAETVEKFVSIVKSTL